MERMIKQATEEAKRAWSELVASMEKVSNEDLFNHLMNSFTPRYHGGPGLGGINGQGITLFRLKLLVMLGQRLKLGLAEKLAQLSAAIDERALSLDQFADELTADGLVEALKEALA